MTRNLLEILCFCTAGLAVIVLVATLIFISTSTPEATVLPDNATGKVSNESPHS